MDLKEAEVLALSTLKQVMEEKVLHARCLCIVIAAVIAAVFFVLKLHVFG